MPQNSIIYLTAEQMELKFSECNMDAILKQCDCKPIHRNYRNPIAKKREHGHVFHKNGETVCIIYYFEDASKEEQRIIQMMVIDGQTYMLT